MIIERRTRDTFGKGTIQILFWVLFMEVSMR